MSEKTEQTIDKTVGAAPVIKKRRSMSIVWIVPLVAIIIGGWLAYKAITEKGPLITVSFKTANGLEAGKTKVKYLLSLLEKQKIIYQYPILIEKTKAPVSQMEHTFIISKGEVVVTTKE